MIIIAYIAAADNVINFRAAVKNILYGANVVNGKLIGNLFTAGSFEILVIEVHTVVLICNENKIVFCYNKGATRFASITGIESDSYSP